MKTVFCRVVLVCLAILLVAGASYSQTQINGAASGNWSSTSSWSPATVPNNGGGNTYNVTLLNSPGVSITLDISPTIDMLTIDSGSNLQASTITSGLTLTTTGLTTAGGITLNNNDTLIVNGTGTNSGVIDLDKNTTLTVNGSFTNSGTLETNIQNQNAAGHPNSITVTGTFTNNAGANLNLGNFNDTADVMSVGSLVNNGNLTINNGATLNMTGQPNGITDVVAGSNLVVDGTLSAGANNGLFKLGSIESVLIVGSGQTFTDTPGSGTLTISSSGELDLENFNGATTAGTNMTISGNLTNSGDVFTNVQNHAQTGKFNTLTVTGTFTNNSGATTDIGNFNDTADVMNVGTLVNNGSLTIGNGATLNLTAQPNGITDVAAGSQLTDYGSIKAGSANGLAKLNSVEGVLVVGTGQTFTDTPGSGTMTISSVGELDLEDFNGTTTAGTSMTVAGNLTNNGQLYTNIQNHVQTGKSNTLTVTGTFTNSAGATTRIGFFGDTTDLMNVATLVNNGILQIDPGATLNLTAQPNGITDVVAGSQLFDYGTIKAGSANALAQLGSIEGLLVVGNGQTTTITPSGGTLTISSVGELDLEDFIGSPTAGTNVTISGNLTNSGQLYTNVQNRVEPGQFNTLTVTGNFINNAGATTRIGFFGDTTDVMNVATLVNNGVLEIDPGATLNLTAQPNGITDVVAGSQLFDYGTIKAGSANALAQLGSIEGLLVVGNGQTTTINPGGISGGTLTISSVGELDLEDFIGSPTAGTNVTISGNLTNSGQLYTNVQNRVESGKFNTLTVTGAFTNSAGATTHIGFFGDSTDVMNVATLVNNGFLEVDEGATLNLTAQSNGVTSVVANSVLELYGTLNAGSSNGLANLQSIAGNLVIGNGQTTNITPTGGTLTISGTNSQLDLENFENGASSLGTNVTITGSLTNSGLVITNQQNRTEGKTNTLTVTGTFTNSGSTIIGDFNDTTDVMNVGTLSNSATGGITLEAGTTLNITSAGTATNNGTIDVGNSGGAAAFKISGNTTLTGTTGKVILSNFAGNIIGGTGTLTNVKNTIEGSGNIGNGTMGLNNQGTIDADQSVPLIINAAGTTQNSLTLEATSGATLQLDAGTYTQTSTGNILASETGNALSAVNLESGVIINGGKLTTTGTTATINLVGTNSMLTLNGVSISGNGSVQLADGSNTTLEGTISNTSTIDLNSTGDTSTLTLGGTTVTLSGTGKIILASNGKDIITGGSGDSLHNGNTIEGPGNIGNGVIGIVNTGIIETVAHQTGNTEIDAGTAGFNNQGTVEAVAATTLYIDNASNQFLNFNSGTSTLAGGTYIVDGTLEFDGANIVTNNASITLSGAASKIVNQSNANGLANLATNGGTFALASGRNFTTIGNFTNNGTLNIGGGTKFDVGTGGMSSLTNYSADTLTGGTYLVTGTLQFNNEGTTNGIVTNDANITLSGAAAKIEDQNAVNMLTNLASNGTSTSSFALASSAKFNTVGNFTNDGTLNVGTGSKFSTGTTGAADLTNYASDTLTGGSYILTGTGQIQFNNVGTTNGIVTNAANITLSGSTATASFIDQNGANMLANFATNSSTGSFTLISSRSFTTAAGFTNAGMVEISKTTTLTIGANGNYSQTGGSTTVDGTLTLGTTTPALNISGGTLFGNGGTINGAVNLTAGNVNPGDGLGLVGDIKVNGNYTQGTSGDLNIDIAGTAANTGYSVLNIVDAASLSGTLNVALENGFVPKVNTKFTIVDYKSDTGMFVTTNFPTVSGDHWTITYNATNVVIELVAGPGPAVIVDNRASNSTSSAATPGTVTAAPARRVSRSAGVLASLSSTHEPVAILSRVTCFAARLLGSASCGDHSVAAAGLVAVHNNVMPASAGPARGSVHNNVMPATASPSLGAAHNNVMVATRSMSSARGGVSRETSISAATMARFYVCAYLPSSVGHTIGCN
jgi:fibronectin-binding autotransporter adhesin